MQELAAETQRLPEVWATQGGFPTVFPTGADAEKETHLANSGTDSDVGSRMAVEAVTGSASVEPKAKAKALPMEGPTGEPTEEQREGEMDLEKAPPVPS